METKTIKISNENYLWLLKIASEMQKRKGCLISFDEALNNIRMNKSNGNNILRLAGTLRMNDREADKFKENMKILSKKWKIQSV